jgi:hypothetical protein
MLTGETIRSGASRVCPKCKIMPPYEVLQTPAGYYIGTVCKCGPYTRETDYFKTVSKAKAALDVFNQTGVLYNERY